MYMKMCVVIWGKGLKLMDTSFYGILIYFSYFNLWDMHINNIEDNMWQTENYIHQRLGDLDQLYTYNLSQQYATSNEIFCTELL